MEERKKPEGVRDLVIIGGGPAGLTAGIYASRARMDALLIESMTVMGQATMTDLVENYPGYQNIAGMVLLANFKEQARSFGLEFASGTVKKIASGKKEDLPVWVIEDENGRHEALSVIVATGASPKKLEVPGEAELTGKGVSYCAICDAAFFRDKEVAVVGGGDTAVEEAMYLAKFASKVKVVHRRDRLRAAKILQERAFANEKISFVLDSVVEGITGESKVSGLKLRNLKTEDISDLACDGVFIFAGWKPNTDFLKDTVEISDKHTVIVDQAMQTSEKGLFACGDCTKKPLHQIITACGDGATAANSAMHYVDELKGVAYK